MAEVIALLYQEICYRGVCYKSPYMHVWTMHLRTVHVFNTLICTYMCSWLRYVPTWQYCSFVGKRFGPFLVNPQLKIHMLRLVLCV